MDHMELSLDGSPTMQATGHITIDLPSYMHQLDEVSFQAARSASDKLERILAIGRHAASGDIVFLTGAGDLRQLDMAQFRVPLIADVEPVDNGSQIRVKFQEDDVFDPIDLEATWAIRISSLLLAVAKTLEGKDGAHITYADEEEVQP
jgi:hypothetical protein